MQIAKEERHKSAKMSAGVGASEAQLGGGAPLGAVVDDEAENEVGTVPCSRRRVLLHGGDECAMSAQEADRVRAPWGSLKTRARCTTTMCAAHSALACRIRARLPSRAAFRPSLSPSPHTLFGTRLTSATSSTLASCPRFSWRACSTRVSATSSCLLAAPALASSSATVRVSAKGGKSQVGCAMPCTSRRASGRARAGAGAGTCAHPTVTSASGPA